MLIIVGTNYQMQVSSIWIFGFPRWFPDINNVNSPRRVYLCIKVDKCCFVNELTALTREREDKKPLGTKLWKLFVRLSMFAFLPRTSSYCFRANLEARCRLSWLYFLTVVASAEIFNKVSLTSLHQCIARSYGSWCWKDRLLLKCFCWLVSSSQDVDRQTLIQ